MGNKEQATDLAHERAIWKVEHWGWTAMGAIIFAALLGLFGSGPLSRATAGAKGSNLWVEYNRFERYQASTEIRIHAGGRGLSTALPTLTINSAYLEKVEIQRVDPEPEQVKAAGDQLIYVFNFAATNQPAVITLHLRPNGYGKVPVRLKFSDTPELQFSQFIYP